jgi:RNA polymerase sigma-70 factor (ECF subfamily)
MSAPIRSNLTPASPPNDPSELDRTWANRIRTGDASAYESVFRALFQPLVGYVIRIVDSKAVAEELVQELFLTLWMRRATLEVTGGSLSAYLFTAARNRALAHIRRERVAARFRDRQELDAKLAEQERSRELRDDQAEIEIALAIAEAVNALPDRCRAVFKLSRQRGLTYAEIGKELEISPRTVENHMAHALRVLRVRLQRFLPKH